MIRISPDQLEAFREPRLRDFQTRTAQELRIRFPDRTAQQPPEATEELVARALAVGERYGVTSAYDIRRLAECLLIHGEDFPETEPTAWAKRILRRDDMNGREKMDAVSDYETFVVGPT